MVKSRISGEGIAHQEVDRTEQAEECRPGCGACCIAPSISSIIPGMRSGKPAGVRCVQLTEDQLCALYGQEDRPAVCLSFRFTGEFCGRDRDEALKRLQELEDATSVPSS